MKEMSNKIIKLLAICIFIQIFFRIDATLPVESHFISGSVLSQDSIPIESAIVALISAKDSTYISSEVCDDKGLFQISYPNDSISNKLLIVSSIGYQPQSIQVESGKKYTIFLASETNYLQELIVTANKPTLSVSAGTYTFLPGILSQQIGYVEGLMELVPILDWNDGIPRIYGQNAIVKINGKRPRMGDKNALNQYLKSIEAQKLVKVEISPRGDATNTSPIINIILQDNFTGFIGSFSINDKGKAATNDIIGTEQLIYSINGWLLTTTLSQNYGVSKQKSFRTTDYLVKDMVTESSQLFKYDNRSFCADVSMNYQFRNNSEIGMTFNMETFKNNQSDYTETKYISDTDDIDTDGISTEISDSKLVVPVGTPRMKGNAYFWWPTDNKGSTFDANFLYWYYANNSKRSLWNSKSIDFPLAEVLQQRNNLNSSGESFSIKRTRKISNKYSIAYGYEINSYTNNMLNEETDMPIDKFKYSSTTNTLYFSTGLRPCNWFAANIGFRGELLSIRALQTVSNNKVSNDFFCWKPSVACQFGLGKTHSLSLNLSRYYDIPIFYSYNPFIKYTSTLQAVTGNPNLKPTETTNASISYDFLNRFSISADYSYSTNCRVFLSKNVSGSMLVIQSPHNIGCSHSPSLSIYYYDWFFNNYLGVTAKADGTWYNYLGHYSDNSLDIHNTQWNLYLRCNIFISKKHKLQTAISFIHSSPISSTNLRFNAHNSLSLSLRKDFSWGGSLNGGVSGLLGSKSTTINNSENIITYTKSTQNPIQFYFGFSYSFGKGKLRDKNSYFSGTDNSLYSSDREK